MTTARMEHAMELADKCWEKAYKASPQFVEDRKSTRLNSSH